MKDTIKKVVFYTNVPRFFRTTLIGNLYEIVQVYPTILLSEKLDPQTEELLGNKRLFPKIEKIVPVHQYTGKKMGLFKRHRHFCRLAKDIIQYYKPDIVIVSGTNFFEAYLRRFARKIGAVNIFFTRFIPRQTNQIAREYIFRIAYLKSPKFLPHRAKILFSKLRMYLGHLLYYWISPLLAGQKPFIKEPSFALMGSDFRFKGVDYFIVFSKQNYDTLKKDGVPSKKIYILSHPLTRETKDRKSFEEVYFLNSLKAEKNGRKTLTVLWRNETIGFRRDDHSFISEEEVLKSDMEVISLISQTMKEWKVLIKPHPVTTAEGKLEIEKTLKSVSSQAEVINPEEPLDKCLGISDAVVGLYPASNALFEAFLRHPDKPILSIDLHHEFGGNFYKYFDGVDYIDSKKKFINILEMIRDGRYRKDYKKEYRTKVEKEEFSNTVEMLSCLFQQKNKHKEVKEQIIQQ